MEGGEEFIRIADEAFLKLQSLIYETDGWTSLDRSKLPPTISSAHLTGEGVKCVKAWGVVKNDHQTVFDLIWNEELATKKKDDDTLLDFKIPFQYGENDQIIYSTYRLPFPLSNREFVFVRSIRKDGDTLYNIGVSVEHPQIPVAPKFVRGNIHISAYVTKPTEDGNCDLCYLVQLDPMGSIPNWLVNANIYKLPMRIEQVQKNYKRV